VASDTAHGLAGLVRVGDLAVVDLGKAFSRPDRAIVGEVEARRDLHEFARHTRRRAFADPGRADEGGEVVEAPGRPDERR
jgi:hypothetical protein